MLLSALLVLAVQEPVETTEAEAAPVEPPLVQLAPAPSPPTPTPPPTAARPSRVLPAADKVDGLNDVATGAVQIGAGIGGCCLGSLLAAPLVLLAVVGPAVATVAVPIVAGVATGGTEVVVGDALGVKRGALVVPVLTSVVLLAAGTAGSAIYTRVVPQTEANSVLVYDAGDAGQVRAGLEVVISTVFTVAAVAVPAIIYQVTAVPKEPGDHGGFPGLIEPADPTGARAKRATTSTTTTAY